MGKTIYQNGSCVVVERDFAIRDGEKRYQVYQI